MQPDFEITLDRLRRIADVKSPYIGIPREGMTPLTLKRDIVKSLADMVPDEARVRVNGALDITWGKSSYRLTDLKIREQWTHRNALRNWAASQRKAIQRKVENHHPVKATAEQTLEWARAKLQRMKDCSKPPRRPPSGINPHFRDLKVEFTPHCRSIYLAWHDEKPVRRMLCWIANNRHLDNPQRYRALSKALNRVGLGAVLKHKQLPRGMRERMSETQYWHEIYSYVGEPNGYSWHKRAYDRFLPAFTWKPDEYYRHAEPESADVILAERLQYARNVRAYKDGETRIKMLAAQIEAYALDPEIAHDPQGVLTHAILHTGELARQKLIPQKAGRMAVLLLEQCLGWVVEGIDPPEAPPEQKQSESDQTESPLDPKAVLAHAVQHVKRLGQRKRLAYWTAADAVRILEAADREI